MKDIAKILLFSALGGIITLGGYKLYLEDRNTAKIKKDARQARKIYSIALKI